MPPGTRNWLTPAAWVAAVTAVLLLLFPYGFPNYDAIYSLVWGWEIAHGMSPDMGAALPPTPHPLAELFGAAAAPLGEGAIDATMVIAYLALGLVGYLVYRLGALWFDPPIGAVAALIVLTRAPFLSNGLRAYVDLPYIALCLGALVIETRRQEALGEGLTAPAPSADPRKGSNRFWLGKEWQVLALLALAGLLRPEAWLFSLAYLAYIACSRDRFGRSRRRPGGEERVFLERADTQSAGLIRPALVRARETLSSPAGFALIALALAAPLGWALFDWITAGSPTYSFTGTRETVETLERQTGPVDLVLYGPRRLGEVLQWPGMVGALGGILLTLGMMRRSQHLPTYSGVNAGIGVAAAALALVAFAVLACAGLAIIPRYTMLAAAILAIFVAFALLGWRLLEPGAPWRRAWQTFAAFVALMFVAWGPNQYDLLHRVDTDLTAQARIEEDLNDLARSGAFEPLCGPISVPNHRAVPRLAFALEIPPTDVVSSSEQRQPGRGYFLNPAGETTIRNFILDPNDPARLETEVPPGFREVARNESWILYRRC